MEKSSAAPCLVPYAAVIAGDDPEAIVARGQIVVEGLAAIADALPIAISAVELVAELILLRRYQAECGVVDLEIENVGGKRKCRFTSA